MGCFYSTQNANDTNPRMFRVFNVDSQGQELNPGNIEITDNELILYQRGKEPIRWPLRCLRRYGFDADLFSFESGRRCPTGPGIYAFKCRRAENLFNVLQEAIQRAGQEENTRPSMLFETASTNSRPGSMIELEQQQHLNGAFVSSESPANGNVGYMQPQNTTQPSSPHYVNGHVGTTPATTAINHIQSNHMNPTDLDGPGHEYMNTAPLPIAQKNWPAARPNGNGVSATEILVDFAEENVREVQSDVRTINYAILDLPRSTENLSSTGGATKDLQYADLDRDVLSGAAATLPKPNTPPTGSKSLNYADLDHSCDEAVGPTYVNIGSDVKPLSKKQQRVEPGKKLTLPRQQSSDEQHSYANLEIIASNNIKKEQGLKKVNYIQLDLEKANDSQSVGPSTTPTSPKSMTSGLESPSRRTEMYTMIDFHKTEALSKTQRPQGDDAGARKTRHNSTVGM
ncbi:unnamed protein product [Owenia fusiformis]|uniref:Uncharacterized protein n=1 Tax=Owenia fusiformis TaxID=6347 RepID=A0A8J1XIU3_OWEFU|nr:unnamed protein product [Owenia fusiformis]